MAVSFKSRKVSDEKDKFGNLYELFKSLVQSASSLHDFVGSPTNQIPRKKPSLVASDLWKTYWCNLACRIANGISNDIQMIFFVINRHLTANQEMSSYIFDSARMSFFNLLE